MIPKIFRPFYSFQIKLLLFFRASLLFEKINLLCWYRGTLQKWIRGLSFADNAKVLELGCATGVLSEYMAECGYTVMGVDSSDAMIKAAASQKSAAEYRVADVYSLPFEDNRFDAVVSASLINVVSDQQAAISEMIRVCKPGGMISVLVPTDGFNNTDMRNLSKSLHVSGFSEQALETWHKFARKLKKQDVETLFREQDLTVAQARDYLQGMVFSMDASVGSVELNR